MAIIKYKGADGDWHEVQSTLIKGIDIVQTSGTSSADVMSQSAVTEIVTSINGVLVEHTSDTDIHLTSAEKANIDSINENIGVLSAITSEDIANWNGKLDESTFITYSATTDGEIQSISGELQTEIETVSGTLESNIENSSGYVYSQLQSVSGDLDTEIQTTSGALHTEIGTVETNLETHSGQSSHMTSTEKENLDSLAANIASISGVSSTKVSNWDTAYANNHTHSNKSALDAITGNVGTMAYENASSYSSATQVNTALSGKSNTGHTHTSNEITAMTNYTSGVTISPISTSDSLNTAIGKLEHALGGVKLVTISQSAYDALVAGGTVDPTTLYVIID